MRELLIQLLVAFVSTVAFSFIYELPVRYIFVTASISTLAYLGYYLVFPTVGYAGATLLAAAVVTLFSRIAAPTFRIPLTTFLIPALFLLVPGKDVFYAAYYLIKQRIDEGLASAGRAIVVSGAIVFGIALVYVIPQKVFNIFRRTQKTPERK